MANTNIQLLARVAKRLSPLLEEVVFVGGCTTGLFLTDQAAPEVRPTFDVDVIAEITSYADYVTFSERLHTLGFREDSTKGAPLCRWLIDDMKLDVMPIDERILGFTNRWYKPALEMAIGIELEPGLRIRVVSAPYFIATKLEAFRGRGHGDWMNSRDLEDLLTVIEGRDVIVEEISAASEVRAFVAEQIRIFLGTSVFLDALPGYLLPDPVSQSRLSIVKNRLTEMSKW